MNILAGILIGVGIVLILKFVFIMLWVAIDMPRRKRPAGRDHGNE